MSEITTETGVGTELRQRIVDAARELFYTHGYSRVSTNEIAQELGISKKTLYKEFETKEDILRAVIEPKLARMTQEIRDAIDDEKASFTDKLKTVMSIMGHKRVSMVLAKDISINAPSVWKTVDEHRMLRLKLAESLIQQGIERGAIRSDIRPEILLRLFTSSLEALMTPRVLEELGTSSHEIFQSIITIFIEGSLSEDTRKTYQRSLKK